MKLKLKYVLFGLGLLVTGLIAALLLWALTPTKIEGEETDLSSDISAFLAAGCTNESWVVNCSALGIEEKYDCAWLYAVPDSGALRPKKPMLACGYWSENESGLVRLGCMAPYYLGYVVLESNATRFVKTKEEFIAVFGAVESPEEAISYASALTGAYPLFELEIPKNYRVYRELKTSYSEPKENGYEVLLFQSSKCGCGPHPVYEVVYFVENSGRIREVSREQLFADPELDGLCVD